jgi:NOL1/NOP2/fmu family ribosome biogenesis protein
MKIHYITSAQKKKIIKQLEEQFGITKLPYLLLEAGKEKVRAFSGHLSKDEIQQLNNTINLELIGLYLIKKESPIRISVDATHLLKDQIKNNIIKIDKEQEQHWLKGQDLEIKKPSGTYIIQSNDLNLGCAKSNSKVLLNHVPKDRRIKN